MDITILLGLQNFREGVGSIFTEFLNKVTWFGDMGYNVEAVDGSKELCELASRHAGIDVKCTDFSSIDYENRYDGIWACASLLHVESKELPSSLCKGRVIKK